MLIYLSSHVFVLFVILLMSTIRQSLIGFLYVFFIVVAFFRTNAYAGSVLKQRDSNRIKRFLAAQHIFEDLKREVKKIDKELIELEKLDRQEMNRNIKIKK